MGSKSILMVIYQTLSFQVSFVFMILILVSQSNYESYQWDYQLIIDNWKQRPIINLRVTTDTCHEDVKIFKLQKEQNFTQYLWPGIKEGCYCGQAVKQNIPTFIYKECNQTFLNYGCTTVPSSYPQLLTQFPFPNQDTSPKSVILCAMVDNNTFYDNAPSSFDCPQSQLKCGTNMNTFFCSSSGKCPLTKITLNGHLNNLDLDINNHLTINTNDELLPIVQGQIQEGQGVCWDNYLLGKNEGRTDYPLMNRLKTSCELNINSYQIYNVSETQFYQVNNLLNYIKTLPAFQIDDNYKWGLFYTPYIAWKMSCRGDIMNRFKGLSEEGNIESLQIILSISSIVYFLFFGVILNFIIFARFQQCCYFTENSINEIKLIIVEYILQQYQIYLLVMTILLKNPLDQSGELLDLIVARRCTDEFTISKLLTTKFSVNMYVLQFLNGAFYLLLAYHLFGLLTVCFLFRMKYGCHLIDKIVRYICCCECLIKSHQHISTKIQPMEIKQMELEQQIKEKIDN